MKNIYKDMTQTMPKQWIVARIFDSCNLDRGHLLHFQSNNEFLLKFSNKMHLFKCMSMVVYGEPIYKDHLIICSRVHSIIYPYENAFKRF